MRAIAGALVLIAGTILVGAAVIADGFIVGAGRSGHAPDSRMAMTGGLIFVVLGLIVFAAGLLDAQRALAREPESRPAAEPPKA